MDEIKYVTFYYHQQDNYILSNFYPHFPNKKLKNLKIKYDGKEWPTSEHLYQALKFKHETSEEKEWRECIRTSNTPGIAKHLGHYLTTKRYKWQQNATDLVNKYKNSVRYAGDINDTKFKVSIMRIALKAKYDSVLEFREFLENLPKDAKLMEDTYTDWGWQKGLLGKLLEELRNM